MDNILLGYALPAAAIHRSIGCCAGSLNKARLSRRLPAQASRRLFGASEWRMVPKHEAEVRRAIAAKIERVLVANLRAMGFTPEEAGSIGEAAKWEVLAFMQRP